MLTISSNSTKNDCFNCYAKTDSEGFGGCTNMGECRAVCPNEISLDFIALMNGDLWKAALKGVVPSQKR